MYNNIYGERAGGSMRFYCTEERYGTWGNGVFYLGNCDEQLDMLCEKYKAQVQLIYLDPPFCTGNDFKLKIGKGKNALSVLAYSDDRTIEQFTEWMEKILTACHTMLKPSGSIFLHIDYRTTARMRLLLDKLFGEDNFQNEIIWPYKTGGRSKKYFPRKHDTILFYRKSDKQYFNIAAVGVARGPERRNHMKRFISEDGRIAYSIRSGGKLYTYYEDSMIYPTDVWSDIVHLQQHDKERTGYATQKPLALMDRIILSSSQENDVVMDLFSGSGTTCVSASLNKRRFVAVDKSPLALYSLRMRMSALGDQRPLWESEKTTLSFYRPCDDCECEFEYGISEKLGVKFLELQSARLAKDESPLIYAASGTVEGDCYLPVHLCMNPHAGTKLQLPKAENVVIQLVNAKGDQAFIGLD